MSQQDPAASSDQAVRTRVADVPAPLCSSTISVGGMSRRSSSRPPPVVVGFRPPDFVRSVPGQTRSPGKLLTLIPRSDADADADAEALCLCSATVPHRADRHRW